MVKYIYIILILLLSCSFCKKTMNDSSYHKPIIIALEYVDSIYIYEHCMMYDFLTEDYRIGYYHYPYSINCIKGKNCSIADVCSYTDSVIMSQVYGCNSKIFINFVFDKYGKLRGCVISDNDECQINYCKKMLELMRNEDFIAPTYNGEKVHSEYLYIHRNYII